MEKGRCGSGHTVGQSSSPSLAVAVEVLEVSEVVGIELAEWQVVTATLFHVHILIDGIEFGHDAEYHDLWTCRPRKNYIYRLTPRRQ